MPGSDAATVTPAMTAAFGDAHGAQVNNTSEAELILYFSAGALGRGISQVLFG